QSVLPQPVCLALERADLLHDGGGESTLRLEDGVVRVLPVEPVALAELFEMLFLADGHEVSSRVGAGCRHTQTTRAPNVKSTGEVGFSRPDATEPTVPDRRGWVGSPG